jgi:hypothetical protein
MAVSFKVVRKDLCTLPIIDILLATQYATANGVLV